MTGDYPYMPLFDVLQYEPAMDREGVSGMARGKEGFLSYYKSIGGNPARVSKAWRQRRFAYIARHLLLYRQNPNNRYRLTLIAWAFMP